MSENQIEVVDIKIFPYRFLSAKTSEKVLNKIYSLDGLIRVIINGESLPKVIGYGPGKGLPVSHTERANIELNGELVELGINVGEIIMTVDKSKLHEITEELEPSLEEIFSFGYQMSVGIFTKHDTTISDYLKYGLNFEDKIDKRFIGMSDPRSKTGDTVKIIK